MLEAMVKSLSDYGFRVKVITYSENKSSDAKEYGRIYRVIKKKPFVFSRLKYFLEMCKLSEWADLVYATDTYSVGYFSYLIKIFLGKKYIIRFAGDSAWETAVNNNITNDNIIDFQSKNYGKEIEKYLTSIDEEKFKKQFAEYAKKGLDKTKVSNHFQEVLNEIKKKYGER